MKVLDNNKYNLDLLYCILLSDNIKEYEDTIFKIIPELYNEYNFEQKSEWHTYDVWNHTIEAIKACDKDKEDRLVLLLHDIGKPFSYQDDGEIRHFHGHAEVSFEMSKNILNKLGLEDSKKKEILELIRFHSTKIDINKINKDNINFYKRLLKIQICDGSAYEIEHSKRILDDLENTKKLLKNYTF